MGAPKKEELTPIMAAFGRAVFEGQNLEHGLNLLLKVIDEERVKEGLKPINADIDDPQSPVMIGGLFGRVKNVESLTKSEIEVIKSGMKCRNYLVHVYWKEEHNVAAMLSPEGRQWLINDLDEKRKICRQADRLVSKFIDQYLSKYGTSVSMLAEKLPYVNDEETVGKKMH